MVRVRPTYTPEFRAEAVELLRRSERSCQQLARDLGISQLTLKGWYNREEMAKTPKKRDKVSLAKSPRTLRDETAEERANRLEREILALRKENDSLRMDREILKKAAANSTGQCNFYRERFRWSHVAESLTRSHVHFTRHSVEVTLGVPREVGAPREVLAKEAVRVFVRATLPRAAGITEINLRVRGDRKALVSSEFGSTIPRERGHYPVGQMLHLAHDGVHDSGGVLALHLDQHQEARAPLD